MRIGGWRTRAETILTQGLQRAVGDRSVAVFEYPLHPSARYGWGAPPHVGLCRVLGAGEERYDQTIRRLLDHADDFRGIPGGRRHDGGLSWDNDYWGGVDAAVHYVNLCEREPKTYIEVGSGYSTMFARRAIEDHHLATRLVSIDPTPRAEIDAICDEVIRKPLEEADLTIFGSLQPGDIVVIDGTHTAFMNSDTVVAFIELLPAIPPGVLVCIDDIFLPWDYPPSWIGRWYGEQYLLACLLLDGAPGWTVQFPAWYLTQEYGQRDRFDPLWRHFQPANGEYAKSFWMERDPVTTPS